MLERLHTYPYPAAHSSIAANVPLKYSLDVAQLTMGLLYVQGRTDRR